MYSLSDDFLKAIQRIWKEHGTNEPLKIQFLRNPAEVGYTLRLVGNRFVDVEAVVDVAWELNGERR